MATATETLITESNNTDTVKLLLIIVRRRLPNQWTVHAVNQKFIYSLT